MTKFFRTFSFERVASVILQLQITKGTNIAQGPGTIHGMPAHLSHQCGIPSCSGLSE